MNDKTPPKNDCKFLEQNWLRSADRRRHQERCHEAAKAGKPKPRIPSHIRSKYIIKMSDLSDTCPTTHNRLVPKEDEDGNVIRDERGEVKFVRQNLPKSKWGVIRAIKDNYRDTHASCGVRGFDMNAPKSKKPRKSKSANAS